MDEQTIQTPIGKITIEPTSDPLYPGVYVSINDTSLVLVEFDDIKKQHVIRVWNHQDPDNDPVYTQTITKRGDEDDVV